MKRAADFRSLSQVVVVTALAIAVLRPIALHAQAPSSEHLPSFEVASIKQNTSDDRRSFGVQPGGHLVVKNSTLKNLITAAYGDGRDTSVDRPAIRGFYEKVVCVKG